MPENSQRNALPSSISALRQSRSRNSKLGDEPDRLEILENSFKGKAVEFIHKPTHS